MAGELELKKHSRAARREVSLSFVFGLVALLIASAAYFFLPHLDSTIFHQEVIRHRVFETTNDGGLIRYESLASEKNISRATPELFRKDLELLCKRFKRGQFVMTRLTGFAEKAAVLNIQKNKDSIDCQLSDDGSATLKVTASGRAAREALHAYFQFLDKYWSNRKEKQPGETPQV